MNCFSDNAITQIGTMDCILSGLFDGNISVCELKSFGFLGIGAVDHLDGELILLNGTAYSVRSSGRADILPDCESSPFATVACGRDGETFRMTDVPSFAAFTAETEKILPTDNMITALHFTGHFRKMKTRSVPRVEKPYPEFLRVAEIQPEFEFSPVDGDLIGFRFPTFLKGVNVPGWHLHFLTSDRTGGGHVLDFELAEGTGTAFQTMDYHLHLPGQSETFRKADFTRDRTNDMKKAESARN